jgi:ribonuclease P protein component
VINHRVFKDLRENFNMETLKKNQDFQEIYNYGKKTFGIYSLIFFKKNKLNYTRAGFVVSKKIGNAVCRNRLKRLFKEYYRLNEKNILKGYDIIIVGKKIAGENYKFIKFQEIDNDLKNILKKSKLLK